MEQADHQEQEVPHENICVYFVLSVLMSISSLHLRRKDGLTNLCLKSMLRNFSLINEAIQNGKITVNGEKVHLTYRLKDNDKIVHTLIRKEIPVLSQPPIDILYEDDNFIAVDKPPSIPVHQTGSYFYNTLLGILEYDPYFKDVKKGLRCVNRLDKQTSGVIFLAKSEGSANEFRQAMEGDTVHKQYLARVQGDFRKACNEETKDVTVNKWVYMKDYKRLFHGFADDTELTEEMRKTAKDAETRFEVMYYDAINDMSVVKCYPKTGRTHQIRVHLQTKLYLIMMLWLHAYLYEFNGIRVVTKTPKWAAEENRVNLIKQQ